MKYEKPEILVLGAVEVIQGGKGYNMTPDSDTQPPNHTNGAAYEADE